MDATKYEVIDTVINDASGRIIIEAYSDDVDAGGSVSVFFKKFDADHQPKIFDDEETKKNADEILTKTFGEDATVNAVIADPNILLGCEFEGYPAEESDNIYLTPRAAFIEFSKIEKKSDEKALTNLVANGATVETLPVTETRGYGISKNGEFWSQHRFNVGIPVEVNGETKVFKVSQLEVIDENDKGKKFSTDYKDGKRGGFTKKTANGMVIAICDADEKLRRIAEGDFDDDPERANRIRNLADSSLDKSRARVVEGVREYAGYDLDDIVKRAADGDKTATLTISDITIGSVAGNDSRFIVATLKSKD